MTLIQETEIVIKYFEDKIKSRHTSPEWVVIYKRWLVEALDEYMKLTS